MEEYVNMVDDGGTLFTGSQDVSNSNTIQTAGPAGNWADSVPAPTPQGSDTGTSQGQNNG